MRAVELNRQRIQCDYDSAHSQLERNMKGQFATPYSLAHSIMRDALERLDNPTTFLEPACGTGAFISAATELAPELSITGIEKDDAVFQVANDLWQDESITILHDDFFNCADTLNGFDLLVTNPPYSRHHHLSSNEKKFCGTVVESLTGYHLSQLSGLHAYFILAGTNAVRPGGVASWLIPSELFSVNYGRVVRDYITHDVTVERVHFFNNDDLQFSDALVSSCVLVLRRKEACEDDVVTITLGSFDEPTRSENITMRTLRKMDKWQHFFAQTPKQSSHHIGDFFTVKRGLLTGAESFYARQRTEWHSMGIGDDWLIPVLPAPRYMHDSRVDSDAFGWPVNFERALLSIPCDLDEADLPEALVAYLTSCPDKIRNSYTARHRKKWFSIERRDPAPIVCTYMSRSNKQPFRFVRNRSKAVVTTAYLCLYPRSELSDEQLDTICASLNSIDPEVLISSGREYGGGLRKLEPKELLSVPFTA